MDYIGKREMYVGNVFFFQLMEHGTNTLHVAFIFLFSVVPFTAFRPVSVNSGYSHSNVPARPKDSVSPLNTNEHSQQ
jgi:hypothetical protein